MRRVKHQKSGAGFTIIEILMGLAILSVLLGIVLPTYQEHRNRVDKLMDRFNGLLRNPAADALQAVGHTTPHQHNR